ncbi:MAG: potassium channel protein [Burkholderiales bacterium]|nr:potassium channel protein [Bacteroidia bacterium]
MFNIFKSYYRFYLPLLIMFTVWVIGTIGYVLIDNYSWFDAFYMTVITVATVGYGEVAPLSHAGKLFTAFLIITSFGTFAYAVSSITKFVIDGEFNEFFKNRKLSATIDKLSDHIIICGYGRNGRQAAQVLKKHDKRFVVIESNAVLTATLNHKFSDLVITGDSTQDDILIKAGILRATALITTLPADADNLFIVLTARNLNKKLTIISRASEDNSDTKLKIAGANNVIMPDKVGGAHMASLVMKPDVMEFIDHITAEGGDTVNLEEISFANVPEGLKNKTLKDLEIRNRSGANIIGYKTATGEYIVNPSADTLIIPQSKLFVLGTPEQIAALKQILS